MFRKSPRSQQPKPVVEDSSNAVFVFENPADVFGLTPSVGLRMGPRYSSKNSRALNMAPENARRLAIALLLAAENVQKAQKVRP